MEGQLLGFVRGWASKLEAVKIKERTMRGKLSRAREGRHPGGRTAYGYKLVNGKQEINPEQAEVVHKIFSWLTEDGMSLRSIQLRLNRMDIPTREGKSWWSRVTVYRIITDPMYAGQWYYNKHMNTRDKARSNGTIRVLRPRDQWIPVDMPAIISQDTFEAAQRQLARNRELCSRNTKRQYLLSGLLVCGNCGYRLKARTTNGRIYYCCKSKLGDDRPKICSAKNTQGEILERVVWDNVSELLSQPELIIDQVKNREKANPTAHLEVRLDKTYHTLEKKKVEEDRMLDAYKIGAIDLQTLKRKMDEIKEEQRNLERERLNLEKELRKAQAQELNEEKLYQFCQSLPGTLANLSFEDKKQILREVVDRIVVDGNEVTIYGIIPTSEDKDMSIVFQSPQ
jgi:site-specific DNA recombinase